MKAFEQGGAGDVAALAVDRALDRQVVLDAHVEVVVAMSGRRMDRAGAGIGRHVLAEHDRHRPRVERVVQMKPLEPAAGPGSDDGPAARLVAGSGVLEQRVVFVAVHDVIEHVRRDEQVLGSGTDVGPDEAVVEPAVERDGLVARQRPWRRRPDRD